MFVGRSGELRQLENLYREKSLAVALVYGEYGIGVSALLKQFMKKKRAAYFVARNALPTANLAAFCLEMKEQGFLTDGGDSLDWQQVLHAFLWRATQEKILLIVDDAQHLQSSAPAFFTALREALAFYGPRLRLLLLFGAGCRSVEKTFLGDRKHPLHGALDKTLHLKALDFFEARPFLRTWEAPDQVALYGATGGVPQYLARLDGDAEPKENIHRLFFAEDAALYKEPLQLLRRELREPATYNSVLCAVACGARRLREIAAALDMECNKVSKYTGVLEELKLLRRLKPAGEPAAKRSFYAARNSMLAFWYRFVFPYFSSIAAGRGAQVLREKVLPQLDSFLAQVFKEICRQYCLRLRAEDNFAFAFAEIGLWWDSATEIDLLALRGRRACFADCHWSGGKIGESQLHALQEKSAALAFAEKHYLLFSKSGFTDACLTRSAQAPNVRLISLPYIR